LAALLFNEGRLEDGEMQDHRVCPPTESRSLVLGWGDRSLGVQPEMRHSLTDEAVE
jgi:hypothetical protein